MRTDKTDLQRRYEAACHRMQSAVALDITKTGDTQNTLKHARVGINSAMSDQGALVALLVTKGIFTEKEYFEAVVQAMEEEADTNVKMVREKHDLPDTVDFA